MNIETVIYSYITICLGMIAFNILVYFSRIVRERRTLRRCQGLQAMTLRSMDRIKESGGSLSPRDERRLLRRLKNTDQITAFDRMIRGLRRKDEAAARTFLLAAQPVFIKLAPLYRSRGGLGAAYYCYLLGEYYRGAQTVPPEIASFLQGRLRGSSLYSRHNALGALCIIGDLQALLDGLDMLDGRLGSYHDKLVTESLLQFEGDHTALQAGLWKHSEGYNLPMRLAALNYMRLYGGDNAEQTLALLKDENADSDLRFAAIRYFGRYPHAAARPELLRLLADFSRERWEYAAVSASALAAYSGQDVVDALKAALRSRDWYVRYNASASLDRMGIGAAQLGDVLNGPDRYAREILQYRLDVRRAQQAQQALAEKCGKEVQRACG